MSRSVSTVALAWRACACVVALASATSALADPADYVFVPYTTAGERVLGYAGGVAWGRDGGRDSQQQLSIGWSPTQRWFTSVYAAWESDDGAGWGFDEWSWLNHVQLTTPGQSPVDVGLLCEVEKAHDRGEGTGFQCGPTFELDTDELQFNLNPLFEKHIGAADPAPVSLGYQWQVKGMWGRGVELGAQGFGELGTWDRWAPASQQSHTLGPAIFTKWTMADGHALQVDAAWLVGVGSGSPKDTLRVRVQHAF